MKTNQPVRHPDAVFLGWEKNTETPLALYYITAIDHPSFGTTVTEDTLREFNLQIPVIPLSQKEAE